MTRIEEEKRVVSVMIGMYCRKHHESLRNELCPECASLRRYALHRLDYCAKGEKKGSCRQCSTHCYSPLMRERIRDVMRYAGPRMIFKDPVAAIKHLIREMK